MKKSNLTAFANVEVLTRAQLKKIMGGVENPDSGQGPSTGNGCADKYLSVAPDCRAQYPAPLSGETANSITQYAQCIASGYQTLAGEGCP
ncbi:hypothetical protein [Pedobacter nototheniae]|uniref:hypothetical protein n=1 Tax=Pedobacter nototheniae TaxID=2488994 RepID=UPI0029316F80|nr:hypothetical protein [Pedobacter nototheniae]